MTLISSDNEPLRLVDRRYDGDEPPLLNLFILGFVTKQNNSNKLEGITFLLVAYTTKNKYNRPWLVYYAEIDSLLHWFSCCLCAA